MGTFDEVPELGEHLGFGVLFDGITYNEDSVIVSLLQQTADFNADGYVDDLDLSTWSAGYGAAEDVTLASGDADRDGDVDGSDFLRWQLGFRPATPPIAASQAVPEPTTLLLIALTGLMLMAKRP